MPKDECFVSEADHFVITVDGPNERILTLHELNAYYTFHKGKGKSWRLLLRRVVA